MHQNSNFLLLFITLLVCISLSLVAVSAETPEEIAHSVLENMDQNVDPCDDFYQYACGGWISNMTEHFPETESRFVRSFNGIAQRNTEVLRSIVENEQNENIHKLYSICMDTDAIEKEGIEKPMLIFDFIHHHLGNATSKSLLKHTFEVSGYLRKFGIGTFLSFSAQEDKKHPDRYLGQISQYGSISLPVSFYTANDEKAATKKEQYLQHMTNMFTLLNFAHASELAERAFEVESSLAAMWQERSELRDPFKTYNIYTLEELKHDTTSIDWDAYFLAFGVQPEKLNLYTKTYIQSLDDKVTEFSIAQLSAYLKWRALTNLQAYMPRAFRDENFDFFGRVLKGLSTSSSRSEVCLSSVGSSLGFAVGKKFVEIMFPEEAKKKASSMIQDIETAIESTLTNAKWMDVITRGQALDKLSKVKEFVGEPKVWPTYESVEITDSYFDTKINLDILESHRMAQQVDKPVNLETWSMTPQTVNAFYDPTKNSINFPAAIMDKPFFSADYSEAMNYGSIGLVMSHESMHAFDDQGRLYDGEGRLRDWWTPDTSARFKERAQCLIDQYSNFELLPGHFVNGAMTLGENIADNVGIAQAYSALRSRISDSAGHETSIVPSFTNYQLFFLSFAQSWCSVSRRNEQLRRLEQDVHSPPKYRVTGVLQNFPEFSEVFQCSAGSRMNPDKKCKVF